MGLLVSPLALVLSKAFFFLGDDRMRPSKTTVDYFPHKTTSGRTIFILEDLYGNDGYAAWFKILEILGSTSGHFYDFSGSANFHYLCAKLKVSGEKTLAILKTLAEVGAIDADLHSQSIIWSDNFCAGLDVVYQKRNTKRPVKPGLRIENEASPVVSGEKTTQRKEEKSKEEKKLPCAKQVVAQDEGKKTNSKFDSFWEVYPKKKAKKDAEKAWKQVKADALFEAIIASVEKLKTSDPQWLKDDGQFIPFPATWLRAGGWEDEVGTAYMQKQTIRCNQCEHEHNAICKAKSDDERPKCTHFRELVAA